MMQHFPMNITPADNAFENRPQIRPWQYVIMEYARVGLKAPISIPDFKTFEDAEIWMCLDINYNRRLRELSAMSGTGFGYRTAV